MSYTVFALKWRPQNFDEIVGQEHVAKTLKNALEKNRLAHAYLFSGPRGVGKTSTARILAKAINCKEGPATYPCGKCSSCLEITRGQSLDVLEIDGASNRGIDEIRVLRENVKFAPASGKYKVYIIDEVHQITPDAFNALLKTLEEPPEFVKFIFATTHPQKVPVTILSRCQRLDFRRIKVLEIIRQLEKIIQVEKIDIDKDVLFAIARSSDGSLRDAESLLDQLFSFSAEKVSLKDVLSLLGLVEQEAIFQLADKIISKDAAGALDLFNAIAEEGKDISVFSANLLEHFRNLMVVKVSKADSKLIDLPSESCAELSRQANSLGLDEIFSFFNILINAQEMAKRLDSERIPLEIALVRLAQVKKTSAGAAIAPQAKPIVPEKIEEPDPPSHPPQEEPPVNITLDEIKACWQNVIDALSKIKISVATYLGEGTPLKIEKNALVISFPKDYSLHKEALERKENRELIEKTLAGQIKRQLRVNFILSKENADKEKQDDPCLRAAMQAFGGRIIKEG